MRDYSITKNGNELWKCEVTDSYGNTHHNYFETSETNQTFCNYYSVIVCKSLQNFGTQFVFV